MIMLSLLFTYSNETFRFSDKDGCRLILVKGNFFPGESVGLSVNKPYEIAAIPPISGYLNANATRSLTERTHPGNGS